MAHLYEIASRYAAIQSLAEDPEADPQMLADTMEAIAGEAVEKIDAIAAVRRNIAAEIAAVKSEEDRLAKRRKALQCHQESLESYVERQMQAMGLKEIKAGIHEAKFSKCPPSVEVEDQGQVPAEFIVHPAPTVDKAGILKLFREKGVIPSGVRIINDRETLRWK